jgi:hypothetical protein
MPDPANIDSVIKQIAESEELFLIMVSHDGFLTVITKDMDLKPEDAVFLKTDNVWLLNAKKHNDVELIAVNDVELVFFKWWGHQITV